MVRRDVAVATLALAFGAAAAFESAKLPFGTIHNPGQGFFPWWTSVVIVLLATILLIQALKLRASTALNKSGRIAKVVALLVVLAAYTFLLDPLGYPHLHVSPRPLYVARVGSPTVDSRSQYGGAYGRRYVCRLCYLAECPAAARPAVALNAITVQIVQTVQTVQNV